VTIACRSFAPIKYIVTQDDRFGSYYPHPDRSEEFSPNAGKCRLFGKSVDVVEK
jgi:hypothetical protein